MSDVAAEEGSSDGDEGWSGDGRTVTSFGSKTTS